MNKNDTFASERLLFHGINETDTDCLVKWRSDPAVTQYSQNPAPLTATSHLEWYQQKYMLDQGRFDFIMAEKASGKKIGFVGVKDICWVRKSGEISYAVAEKAYQRKGYAKEAVCALENYLRPYLTILYAVIHQENTASVRTAASLKFDLDDGNMRPFIRYKKIIKHS